MPGSDTETASSLSCTHMCERCAAIASWASVCLPSTYSDHSLSRIFLGRRDAWNDREHSEQRYHCTPRGDPFFFVNREPHDGHECPLFRTHYNYSKNQHVVEPQYTKISLMEVSLTRSCAALSAGRRRVALLTEAVHLSALCFAHSQRARKVLRTLQVFASSPPPKYMPAGGSCRVLM